ncbi:hypothetical protein [Nonomuraea endophytica]|uniref:hypothetical protein n=1 Tax=Nonomuraea endophytica TaxID=714136 RepID=UPI0037C84DEA
MTVKYYVIVDDGYPAERPAGMVRRVQDGEGYHDEALEKDLEWRGTGALVEWEFGNSPSKFVQIGEDLVPGIIEQFRERWSELR